MKNITIKTEQFANFWDEPPKAKKWYKKGKFKKYYRNKYLRKLFASINFNS